MHHRPRHRLLTKFMRHLTNEEQQRLLNWLPVANTAKVPDRLESLPVMCVCVFFFFFLSFVDADQRIMF